MRAIVNQEQSTTAAGPADSAESADRRSLAGVRWARRGNLFVPDVVAEPAAPAGPVDAEPVRESAQVDRRPEAEGRPGGPAAVLERELAEKRDLTEVRRRDERARRTADIEHQVALATVEQRRTSERRKLRDGDRDAQELAALKLLHQRAVSSGTRARIRADIQRSAEMRALRVVAVQRGALWVGLPVLLGFAAWSTTGVQAGMVRLLDLKVHSAGWWAAWIVEPLLITIVAALIIVRAVLSMSGGRTDSRADRAEWGALSVSILLNLAGGWTGQGGVVAAFGEALGHAVGAIGAAVTAWLIGVVIDYTIKARPWENAKRLADLGLLDGLPNAVNLDKHAPAAPEPDGLPDEDGRLLADVRQAIGAGELSPDPKGYAIYRQVMRGQGDKARAYRVAAAVAGWRPPLHTVA
jgi:hypothetical protein